MPVNSSDRSHKIRATSSSCASGVDSTNVGYPLRSPRVHRDRSNLLRVHRDQSQRASNGKAPILAFCRNGAANGIPSRPMIPMLLAMLVRETPGCVAIETV